MSHKWIAIEIIINAIEVCTVYYLLCSKFTAKKHTFFPTLIFIILNILYLSLPYFNLFDNIFSVEIIGFSIELIYLALFRNGNFFRKVFWVALSGVFIGVISIFAITTISFISNVPSVYIITESSNVRLQLLIITRIFQLIIFFTLSRGKKRDEMSWSWSLTVCYIIPLISLITLIITNEILLKSVNNNISTESYSIFSISFLLINIVIFILYEVINKEVEKHHVFIAKQKQYEITEQHNHQIIEIYNNMRKWKHDYSNHMQLVMSLLEKSVNTDENLQNAKKYIKDIDKKITESSVMVQTGNYLADAIITAKMSLAYSFQIAFEYNASLPDVLPIIDNTDLCALLSNLLDNAIESCCKVQNNRYIGIELSKIKQQLHIVIKNSTDGMYIKENGRFKSTKHGNMHGIGLKHIESIVVKYDGIYNISTEDDCFQTNINIPLFSD